MKSVEMFSGIGGMALGLSNAGFNHVALFENSKAACDIIRTNQKLRLERVRTWPLIECDVRKTESLHSHESVDLLSAGPPCQPFSFGGKHKGKFDSRNLFPEVIRFVRMLRPKAILIENVKGLLRSCFTTYFSYILLQLTYPFMVKMSRESWMEHLSRLERQHSKGNDRQTSYNLIFRVINSADYGVPQKRERVFIVGFRNELGIEWTFPNPTHSYQALLWSQHVTGEYCDRHKISKKMVFSMSTHNYEKLVRQEPQEKKPWKTVRDAIGDLPPFGCSGISNHVYIPGAKSYRGHTGSNYDEPSKTLKAGVHGVPGGENTIKIENGKVRYFSIRECARLQTFPDDFYFSGSWSSSMRCLGNSVPVLVSEVLGRSIHKALMRCQ